MTDWDGKTAGEIAEELIQLCREKDRSNEPLPVQRIKEALKAGDEKSILEARIPDPDDSQTHIGLLCYVCQLRHVTLELVKYLVELCPKDLTYPLTRPPLHHACENSQHIPLEIVEYLIDQNPKALRSRTRCQPLGWVLHEDDEHPELRLDLLKLIVQKDPGCIGASEMHMACQRKKVSLEMIQILVDQRPESLTFESPDTMLLPVHSLFSKNRYSVNHENVEHPDTELVKFMLEGNMDAAKFITREEGIMNLLHMACKRGAPLATISLIVDAYPEACERTSGTGILPLHYYCESGDLNLAVLQYLVDTYPPALQHIGRNGIPLVLAAGERLEVVKFLTDRYTPETGRIIAKCYHAVARIGTPEVIEYFAKIFPTGFASLFNVGYTILHSACTKRFQSQRRLQTLLDVYPESIHMADESGNLPLHHACAVQDNLAWPDAILFSLINYPGAAMATNRQGQLPLHTFLSKSVHRGASMSANYIVQELLQAYPAAVKIADRSGMLPIHLACKNRYDATILELLVELYPSSLQKPTRDEGLPIHIAAKEHDSLEAIQYIAGAYKEGLNAHIHGIGLPVLSSTRRRDHSRTEIFEYLFGLRYQQEVAPHAILQDQDFLDKEEITRFLLSDYEKAFRRKDLMGRLPVHYAVSSDVGVELISDLLGHFPESAAIADKSNSLPLHYALRDKTPSASIEMLLDAYNEGACIADDKGDIALHLACQHGATQAVINRIIQAYPEGAALPDINGCLPLHLACRKGAPVEIVRSLITSHPEGLVSMDNSGEYPLHKACRGAQLNLIEYLSDLHPQAIKVSNNGGMFPALLLAQSSGKNDYFGKGLTEVGILWLEGIWRLLRVHPEAFLVTTD